MGRNENADSNDESDDNEDAEATVSAKSYMAFGPYISAALTIYIVLFDIVNYLANHPKVKSVSHPSLPSHKDHALYKKYFPNGAGSIFTFEIKGTQADAWKFIDSLKIFTLLANVADVKSLVIHPFTTTHSQLSEEELSRQHITPTTIRLSIGVEHIDDIIADLDQAFKQI